MGTPYPIARTARRITYNMQTHDVRMYQFEDAVLRTRRAVTRAGGELLGGVYAPKKHIRRWCVNRSPHVNKTSREHFWLITHRRIFRWDAPAAVDPEAPIAISEALPANVAVRVVEERPGLMCLRQVWDTLQASKEPPQAKAEGAQVEQDKNVEDGESSGAVDGSFSEKT